MYGFPFVLKHSFYFVSLQMIYDGETGQSCGYGFVTMSTVQEAEKAVKIFHHSVSISDTK